MLNASASAARGKLPTTRHLKIDSERFQAQFNREPLEFSHDLSSLPMFSEAALRSLAGIYDSHPRDYYVVASAPTAGTEFFCAQGIGQTHRSHGQARLRCDSDTAEEAGGS